MEFLNVSKLVHAIKLAYVKLAYMSYDYYSQYGIVCFHHEVPENDHVLHYVWRIHYYMY